MKNIVFENIGDRNQFTFNDENGTAYCFEYHPSIVGLWNDLNTSDFDVQLLIHPFLNKESNVFFRRNIIKFFIKQLISNYLFG